LRLIDFCITQLEAQGPSRNCNESKEEEGVRPCGLGSQVYASGHQCSEVMSPGVGGVGLRVWGGRLGGEGVTGHGVLERQERLVVDHRAPCCRVLNVRTTSSQKCEAVPRRARI